MNMFRTNVFQQLNDLLVAADCHQIHAVYAGVGSQKTPLDVLDLMTRISRRLDEWGWMLRSGGADGADTAFALGSTRNEIYLPWPGFNGVQEPRLVRATSAAESIAQQYHPNWKGISQAARKFLSRDTHQILGADCKSKASMVVCWTKEGSLGPATHLSGGTNQTIRVAYAHQVPIFNLRLDDHRAAWEDATR